MLFNVTEKQIAQVVEHIGFISRLLRAVLPVKSIAIYIQVFKKDLLQKFHQS